MSSLIVIRITPQSPVDAMTFAGYLNGSGLGQLTITAYALNYDTVDNQPKPGAQIGQAVNNPTPALAGWTQDPLNSNAWMGGIPAYPAGVTSGIFQQVDYNPISLFGDYELESVATAIIEIPAAPDFENLRIEATWGTQGVPIATDFYDVALAPGPTPDLSTWSGNPFQATPQPDLWGALSAVSLYISLPKPPGTANPLTLQLPSDGTPPDFDDLLKAVNAVLNDDPGAAVVVGPTAAGIAGGNTLTFLSTDGITIGMSATAGGIPPGTVVAGVNSTTGVVTFNQEFSAGVPGPVKFTPSLGALTLDQCQNIAYEIVWSQQPPLPSIPSGDILENLYTNPPNDGSMMNGSTPNPSEGDRQQFEAQLKSYYATADTTANQLTNYVFALSAAVACEQMSLAADVALLEFPVNPDQPGSAPVDNGEVILTGLCNLAPNNFGVPAAFFYALGATMPTQSNAPTRYQNATGRQLSHLLSDLTTAINAGTIADTEAFVTPGLPSINAAQAARQIAALDVPEGSGTAVAPLDTVELLTVADASSGNILKFDSAPGVNLGMTVSGTNIVPKATVTVIAPGAPIQISLSQPILDDVPTGSEVIFTPSYTAEFQALIQAWLIYPTGNNLPPGVPSSQAYQSMNDATGFWPGAANSYPNAFLGLVLSALTQGYMLSAPFNVSLGDEIINVLLKPLLNPPTVATLASVTTQQWTSFFQSNPAFLPQPSTGNTSAQIDAFLATVKKFFTVAHAGPASSIVLAANGATGAGGNVLNFASTAGIVAPTPPGTVPALTWTVIDATNSKAIQNGTTVTAVTATTVTVSPGLTNPGPGVSIGDSIIFTPSYSGANQQAPPLLRTPGTDFTDWLQACITAYTNPPLSQVYGGLGTGFNVPILQEAAALVFPNDQAAQNWVVDALVTLDALYNVIVNSGLGVTKNLEFSIAEALYARGFKSAADMTELSSTDFQQALIGTVAYDYAGSIYTYAATIAPPSTPPTCGPFHPINPGLLTNCIPPDCLSPLGPVEYLNELLQLSPSSTCEKPLTPTALNTLGSIVSQRRGPIGNLLASCANLETQLPLIDIANECLEYLGSVSTPTDGTIYQTSADEVACLPLWRHDPCEKEKEPKPPFHDPCRVYAALPEYSTPATPVTANSAVDPAVYNKLKSDFSSCCLPYSQAIDVSRTYLRHLRSCRSEEMRTFRKCITEFVLDPTNDPTGFESYLWRYPVRVDIAIEYLGITPEEYEMIFQGSAAPPCAIPQNSDTAVNAPATPNPPTMVPGNSPTAGGDSGPLACWQLYGFSSPGGGDGGGQPWTEVVSHLPEFLRRTCLTYCEFIQLWKCGYVAFCSGDCGQSTNTGPNDPATGKPGRQNPVEGQKPCFPDCEPCCLENFCLQFPENPGAATALCQLAIFIRLWRKLKESHCFCYSFDQLRDICDVLQLYEGGAINPDFIRQFAAFQMLRDHFHMELFDRSDKIAVGAIDADRTQLLALWVGPTAAKWKWAVKQLIEKVECHAVRRHKCDRRSAEFVKLLASNLDPLSSLCGFDPTSSTNNWHALPTHTLRFAEVLAKIYASNFSVGELIYLFTAQEHLDGDDPFPLQEQDEALDSPLGLPEDGDKFSLSNLRCMLLEARVDGEEVERLHWKHIDAALQEEFGFAQNALLAFGQHFFPEILEHAGYSVNTSAKQFVSSLPGVDTVAAMWNTPADGPFQYDSTAQNLWTQLPLTDEAVIHKLMRVRSLDTQEQTAVQDLYFQPRAMLAQFAVLFTDFSSAQTHLIEERDERERWNYFRREFALCRRRCAIIAKHLTHHVAAVTEQEFPDGDAPALLILRQSFADENMATTNWENDDGATPPVTWTPPPSGGALAALLGLAGTGLIADYKPEGGAVVWRSLCGALSGFGRELDKQNCPVPCVLPAMGAALTPEQMKYVSIHNGFLMKDASGAWLGGGQGFEVKWHGALLVEKEGTHEFWGGGPTAGDEKPSFEAAEHSRWRMTLKRGQRTWIPLSHHWMGEEEHRSSSVPLKRGVYELTIELVQPAPDFPNDEQVRAQRAGFQVKYSGPDTDERRIEIPHHRLFCVMKDETLGQGVTTLSPGATAFLGSLYSSSLRDIRRTYQRAFKALLFAHRFALSASHSPHGTSELGYMLSQPSNFAGASYYAVGGGYTQHLATFDFNFLPLLDDYHAPTQDQRTSPSAQRIQAMFDWWERIFDYSLVRKEVRHRSDRHLWHLFEEAEEKQPAHPDYLLRHMGADSRHWSLDLRFYQGESVPVYSVSSTDLEDDRWAVRAWHADQWLRALECSFTVKDITVARPDLWAACDPSALVSGETQTGNANLSCFLYEGCLGNGEPRRYEDVKRLNDGLRERGRNALVAYLCHMNRVALPWLSGQYAHAAGDLSDLLLLDVETGICEKASRIEEAITAVQNFVLRARLQLEPSFTVTHEFCRMWEREFATFRIWQACKRRHLYKENWVEWSELEKARGVEAFRFLESKLRSSDLTVAVPGGLEWWPDQRPPAHQSLEPLQKCEPSDIQALTPLPGEPNPGPREGFALLGIPERDARPSWLTALELPAGSSGGNGSSATPPGTNVTTSNPCCTATKLPFWIEAAIRLGKRFIRIAAGGVPPARLGFEPHNNHDGKCCVTCCEECGCCHPPLVDEYYFWLIDGCFYEPPTPPNGITTVEPDDYQYGYQDDFYDPVQQEAAYWQDPTQVPELLEWTPQPMVRLAWCRVHNGEFQQPRRSQKGVAIQVPSGGPPTDLTFLGRTADSLVFSVNNGVAPEGYSDPEAPGFRYDLAGDDAVVLPLLNALSAPPTFLEGLPAYPYFVYEEPGKQLFPLSMFSPSVVIAQALRSHCRFESALKWYRLVFDPVQCDCSWLHCESQNTGKGGNPNTPVTGPNTPPGIAVRENTGDGSKSCCCDSTDITCREARHRAIILLYLETLVEWGEAVMRRGHSREAEQHARQIFDTAELILGKRPINVHMPCPANPATVANFKPAFAPLNPRLLDLYDVIQDRLDMIHASIDSRRLTIGKGCCDQMPYFGDNPTREGWRMPVGVCAEESEWCYLRSPYRFMVLIQKALDHASKAQEFGAAFLAAQEKGDAEYLASLHALYDRELLTLGLDAKKDQWRDADWQVAALQDTKAVSQSDLVYTTGLINAGPEGKIDDELQYENQTSSAISLRGTANITEGIGEAMRFIPDFVLGGAGFGGSPVAISWIPLGTKIGEALEAVARIMNNCAEIDSMNAGYDLTEAQWERRLKEWIQHNRILEIQIQQVERQILGAQRRRAQTLRDLNTHVRQMEQSVEAENFLRDKFTAHDLYLFLQKETSALCYKMYDLALHTARQAQFAFNLERGHTARRFIPDCMWDNLHDGLLAGERLSTALRHMEKEYLDENVREYELTKNFSLRLHFPMEFLRLRTTGVCEIELPEWMFDLDFPGQYMRRIKNLSVTIPCVTGPFTGVHCRMTLLSSMTRIDPRLTAPVHECCCPPKPCDCECTEDHEPACGYEPCPDDPRIVRQYGARQAIATSTGQNDSGLFELNFNDERYLPFEYQGAISRWRIELRKENNFFHFRTLSDFMISLKYTAREGGELLERAASHIAHHHLPGDGWCFFDVRHEFPDAWQLFEDKRERRLDIHLDRKMFPFLPGSDEIWISKMAILFSACGEHCHCPKAEGCSCSEPGLPAHQIVEYIPPRKHRDHDDDCKTVISCYMNKEWPGLYCGFFEAHVGPLPEEGPRQRFEIRFPERECKIDRVFLLCRYSRRICDCNDDHDKPALSVPHTA